MATYDYQQLLDQTCPQLVKYKEFAKTRYEQTLADYPNQVDLSGPIPATGLIVLAEARSTSGIPLDTQPANEYRLAINNFAIEIDITLDGNISITNPALGDKNGINQIKCLENHIEFLEKLTDYETMHFDVYTRGRFRLSNELMTLLVELINNITAGQKYSYINYCDAGLKTQLGQEPPNSTQQIIFNGWVYTKTQVAYKFGNTKIPEVILK
jgi:hypothetical protein